MFQRAVPFLLFLFGIYAEYENQSWESRTREMIQKKLDKFPGYDRPPKNIIIFLGDGMGIPMVTVARIYKGEKLNQSYEELPFSFENFQFSSLVKTSSFNKHVTDSAASAVALFCGHKVDQDTLGLLPGRPTNCSTEPVDHINDGIAELALKRGLSVGFVTTDKITGATPGALYVKGVHRDFMSDAKNKYGPLCEGKDIASQLLQYPGSEFKVLMGGGSQYVFPLPKGERTDGRDISQEWLQLSGNRVFLDSPAALDNLDPRRNAKVLGLFSSSRFPFYLNETIQKTRRVPRLKELTEKAIQIMERDNPNGYFLMVEGGNIDIAEHANSMRLASEELLEFDEAIKRAQELVNPFETLLLVTADHSHAVSLPGYLDKAASVFGSGKINGQRDTDPKVPGIFFAVGPSADRGLTYDPESEKEPNFQSPSAIYALYGSHGGEDVGLWAEGPYSWLFSGTMENTEVAHAIKQLFCLYSDRANCILFKPSEVCSSASSVASTWIAIISLIVALLTAIIALALLLKKNTKIYT